MLKEGMIIESDTRAREETGSRSGGESRKALAYLQHRYRVSLSSPLTGKSSILSIE
jgi:hypothetical protein